MNQKYIYTTIVSLLGLLLVVGGVWFFFFRSSTPAQTNTSGNLFNTPADTTGGTGNATEPSNTTQTINTSGQTLQKKIFQISPGPVVGATFIQTLRPTTTLARYIKQEDGHVFDLPLDVPGAVPRVVSNVTIPGGARAIWVEGGSAAVMQYLDDAVVKSVYLGFPAATSSSKTLPTRIQFLPDAIVDIAASPDGKSVAYLLKTSAGVDGYTAKADGTGSKKIFSLPLSQMLISWPSPGNLLIQTKSAVGVPGIVFSIDAKSRAVTPLVYSTGISAIADRTFSHVFYQADSGNLLKSYSHDVKTGNNVAIAFSLFPEKCAWGIGTTTLYCAAPYTITATPSFIDLWHAGAASIPDFIYRFSQTNNKSSLIAAPGTSDGGDQSDILEMALSPDEHYLSFTTKGSRALWGVRLSP
jgi:hypothetical protein